MRDRLNQTLFLVELTKALKSLEKNKTPRSYSLPVNLYSALWYLIGQDLLEVYDSMLLAGNYKILSKIIANQVQSAVGWVIHPDQTCAVPGRTISDSPMLLRDTSAYVQDWGVDTCLISLDQEKAFDRISHTYMRHMLSKMGFGEGICKLIQLLLMSICDQFELASGAKRMSGPFPEHAPLRHPSHLPVHLEVKMNCVYRDTMYETLDKWGKNVPNASLILMATFVCGCIKLCINSCVAKDETGSLPPNASRSWIIPYHLSFVEKFAKKTTFDHKTIRKWRHVASLRPCRESRGCLEASHEIIRAVNSRELKQELGQFWDNRRIKKGD
eukprot:g40403.t1